MAPFDFAKPAFDVAMTTNLLNEHVEFWSKGVGLEYDHLAKLGGGVHQHRWRHGDSIIKINHTRTPLEPAAPAGFRSLTLRSFPNADLVTPDNTAIRLRNNEGADLTLHVATANMDDFCRFYGDMLGLVPDGKNAFLLGRSRIVGQNGKVPAYNDWRAMGLRYMTVQIFDCDLVTAILERSGAEVAIEPITLGQVRYSFVRDCDGNWIELSERATLTGKPIEPVD